LFKTDIYKRLEEQGYAARVVDIGHLSELRENIEKSHRDGVFDEDFYQTYLSKFNYGLPEDLPEAKSLIVVASRQPQVRLIFNHGGKQWPVIVPPTYLHAAKTDRIAREILMGILGPEGYHITQARLPVKILAVRSGLATYGRNNVTYVEGMGSFFRLSAFYSDLPPEEHGEWRDMQVMQRCEECLACTYKCPTRAIDQDRFLLYAEKCITYHNEKPGEIPFPDWIKESWHNCLVGCMICQKVCPENVDYTGLIEDGPEFSEEETTLLLDGTPRDKLPAPMVKKLEDWDLMDILDIIPRNLSVLLE
jgi:epoxyqueuosine reductase